MAETTSLEPEDWALWRTFLAANARLTLQIDRQLQQDSGLAQGEYGTLAAILDSTARALRVGELARQLAWEKSRVSHLITRMERRGLVERAASAEDGRGSLITVTPAGRRALLRAVRGHAAEVRQAFLGLIRPDERAVLERVLRRLATGDPASADDA
ncbi:MarR family winged helix-turn-helix transcriptional regulator [Microbacterium sp. RD1]|uniref:MarR family winged helix-turn-helix transcriptional regulator n=1 Tax=Microbacterium sp. RD1 TaxID=3457313 RepID=UPI003FA5C54B